MLRCATVSFGHVNGATWMKYSCRGIRMMRATMKTQSKAATQQVRRWAVWVCGVWAVLGAACSFDGSQLDKGECQIAEDCGFGEQCMNFVCVPQSLPDIVEDQGQAPTACGLEVCAAGQACCNYACVDTRSDQANCGGCGVTCADNEVCTQGVCACGDAGVECDIDAGDFCCGEGIGASCVNVRSNAANCGGCGLSCKVANATPGSTAESCSGGACVCRAAGGNFEQCAAAQSCCDGVGCADLQTDAENCGACGVTCGVGESCVNAQCACGATAAEGEPACEVTVGQQCCGSPAACVQSSDPTCFCGDTRCLGAQLCCAIDTALQCINSDRDPLNCGGCGVACAGGEVCEDGACTVTCVDGWVKCDVGGRDVCVDPAVSEQFCGAKGSCQGTNPASADYAGQACAAGTVCNGAGACALECQAGLVACDVGGSRRCVDPSIDARACGAKGQCSSADNASADYRGVACDADERCVGGSCQCPGQLILCNGACVDPFTSSSACGAAGACSSATPGNANYMGEACAAGRRCEAGQCECAPGLVECNGQCIDPRTDAAFCGVNASCTGGDICNEAGERCEAGACVCAPGLVSCGGACVDPRVNRDFCGAKGTCQSADPTSLNFRGLDCADGTVCNGAGACALSCAAGLVLCNGACVDPQSNPTRCGARGTCSNPSAANANYQGATCDQAIGQACVTGQCQCIGGEALCGGKCINPQTDESFCGAAANCTGGDICTLGEVCVAGQCQCGVGLILCNGQCIDPDSHPAYCGAFANCTNGRVCVPGSQCVAGSCLCGGTGSVCSTNEGASCTGTTCNP